MEYDKVINKSDKVTIYRLYYIVILSPSMVYFPQLHLPIVNYSLKRLNKKFKK